MTACVDPTLLYAVTAAWIVASVGFIYCLRLVIKYLW